jgi:hypothetical protein
VLGQLEADAMSQAQFHHLARAIFACEQATTDPVQQVYWMKHFVRLISLARNSNLKGV